MSSDANDIIDTTCSVCGDEVRGEKVVWKHWAEGLLDEDRTKALGAIEGSHVCGKCGTALCKKTHKKEVKNAKSWRGYWSSPCPTCGEPLLDGFLLFEPPAGTVFPEKVESSTGHDDHIDKHPVEPSNAVEWKRNPIEDGVARFDCSHCDYQQTLSIEVFKDSPENGVDGFTDKRDFVREAGLANGIALLVGLVAFVLVYRAVFGPELVVSVGVIIPALVAVVSHTVARFVFGIIPFIRGSKMPIYGYTCSKCKEEIVFASDGSQLALQIQKENTQARAIS